MKRSERQNCGKQHSKSQDVNARGRGCQKREKELHQEILAFSISQNHRSVIGEEARVACLLDFLISCHKGQEVEPWTVFNIIQGEVLTV